MVRFCVSAPVDLKSEFRSLDFQGSESQPLVRFFDLPPVPDFWSKIPIRSEPVADALISRVARESMKQAAACQTAVAEPRLFFLSNQRLQVEAQLIRRLFIGS